MSRDVSPPRPSNVQRQAQAGPRSAQNAPRSPDTHNATPSRRVFRLGILSTTCFTHTLSIAQTPLPPSLFALPFLTQHTTLPTMTSKGLWAPKQRSSSTSAHQGPRRIGQWLYLKPASIPEYKKCHAAVWPAVLEQIKDSNIKDCTPLSLALYPCGPHSPHLTLHAPTSD
jgi:hypothetical protein